MVKRFLIAFALVCAAGMRGADTLTGLFADGFMTLYTEVNGNRLMPPVIILGSDDRLTISFDELADDRSYLRYSLTHCNADWQPSQLTEPEYLEGFNICDVDDWDYSRLALTHYINYRITLPNDCMRFTVSGNYLLKVWREDDPSATLLQQRFMVCEPSARISAEVRTVTDIDYNESHQQLAVEVDTRNAGVDDIFNDLILTVSQNGRTDNEVTVRQPLRVSGTTAIYDHLRPLIFEAGNEYRRFETVSTLYPGMGVEETAFYDPYYHATLLTDGSRAASAYVYDQTQNGRFVVREYNSDSSDTEADYVAVHFSLDVPEMPGRMIFLDGDFTCRRLDPNSLMVYNQATGRYEKTLLLKQGAYNYQYLAADGAQTPSTAAVEGNYHQTRNEYLVKVYHRRRGERYDRLIGVGMTTLR